MPTLTPESFRKEIGKGAVAPIYVLSGEDDVAKTGLIAALADTVEQELRAFNVERLYAAEAGGKIAAVLDAARTLPWMAPRRIVVVMQAEKLLASRPADDGDEQGSGGAEDLEAYLSSPLPTTVLVLVVTALDRRLNLTKVLLKHAAIVECGGVAEGRDVETWIKARAAEAGITFEPAAVRTFVDRTGGDVARVRGDLDRLLLFASGTGRVTASDVDELVGAAGSRDTWALSRALERNATSEALRELALLLDEGAVPYMVLGQIRAFVDTGVPPARLPAATDALMRTDLALKMSGGDARVLLERLIVELSAGRGR